MRFAEKKTDGEFGALCLEADDYELGWICMDLHTCDVRSLFVTMAICPGGQIEYPGHD